MKLSSLSPRTPSWRSGSCAVLLVACLLFSGVSNAAPCITLSKKSGPPTSKILVSGRGFEPPAKVDIYFGTKDEKLVVTNGEGEFKDAEAYAPRCARPGKHWVTALERNNHERAQKPFLVRTNWSQFRFGADGTRLNPYENVLDLKNVGKLELKWSYVTEGPCLQSLLLFSPVNVQKYQAGNGAVGYHTAGGWQLAAAMEEGSPVGRSDIFETPGAGMCVFTGTFGNSGWPWCNATNRYLGLEFKIKGKTHYGWARLTVTGSYGTLKGTLTGYAYETIPGKAIIAGKTKGPDVITVQPGSLGQLALGRK